MVWPYEHAPEASVSLIVAAGLVLSACTPSDARRDLAGQHDPRLGRLCEAATGAARTTLPKGRVVRRYPEGIKEERLLVPLCDGTVEAELAFDESQRIDRIILTGSGSCLHGLCIGDRYSKASGDPHVKPFHTREEGGIVALTRLAEGVGYSFDLEALPEKCLAGRQPCEEIGRLRLDAIIIGRPDTFPLP